jgi:hypothetical protein
MKISDIINEALNEISMTSVGDDDKSSEYRRFNNSDEQKYWCGDITNAGIASLQDPNDLGPHQFFFTDDDGEASIGYTYTAFGKNNFAKTSMIWIEDEYRGNGMAGEFYEWLLEDMGKTLISDTQHSGESQAVWWKLVKKFVANIDEDDEQMIETEDDFDNAYASPGSQIVIYPVRRKVELR